MHGKGPASKVVVESPLADVHSSSMDVHLASSPYLCLLLSPATLGQGKAAWMRLVWAGTRPGAGDVKQRLRRRSRGARWTLDKSQVLPLGSLFMQIASLFHARDLQQRGGWRQLGPGMRKRSLGQGKLHPSSRIILSSLLVS